MQRRRILVVEAELSVRNAYEGEFAGDGAASSLTATPADDPAHVILEITGDGLGGTCLGKILGDGLTLAVVLSGSDHLAGPTWSGRAFFLDGSRLRRVKCALHPLQVGGGVSEPVLTAEPSLQSACAG